MKDKRYWVDDYMEWRSSLSEEEIERYTRFTLWDEIKFWGAVAIIFLVVITLIGEVTGLIDGLINWLSK